jgi:hypothetical protein
MIDLNEMRALVERLDGYTPGPLHIRTAGGDAAVCNDKGIVAECFGAVAHQHEDTGRSARDAELYAAAPDLHAALTAALDEIEAARLPRPECASTWTLDPKFVMQVTHEINRIGWDTCMEVVELAMLAAERALRKGDDQ